MNYFTKKIEVIHKLKAFLDSKGFYEVLTPIIRKDAGSLIPRIKLEKSSQALRDSHELQLRYLLSEYKSIYEIGYCFRSESEDSAATNAQEFLLMELFSSRHNLKDLKELTKQFISYYMPDAIFFEISIAEQIKLNLGIDLFVDSEDILVRKLKEIYEDYNFDYDYEYILHYIETEIEPLSKGKIVFFTDYPECTTSYAKIDKGHVISRFELFADGLELANGFDDECDPDLFFSRNSELPIFPKEENAIIEGLLSGDLPSHSSGVGIGIERLCMYLFDRKNISDFSFISDCF